MIWISKKHVFSRRKKLTDEVIFRIEPRYSLEALRGLVNNPRFLEVHLLTSKKTNSERMRKGVPPHDKFWRNGGGKKHGVLFVYYFFGDGFMHGKPQVCILLSKFITKN